MLFLTILLMFQVAETKKVQINFELKYDSKMEVSNKDVGFYREVKAAISSDFKNIFVFDIGNGLLKHFNSTGELLNEFVSFGNGPGELSKIDVGKMDVFTSWKYIFLRAVSKLLVYDFNGKLIAEKSFFYTVPYTHKVSKDVLHLYFPNSPATRFSKLSFSKFTKKFSMKRIKNRSESDIGKNLLPLKYSAMVKNHQERITSFFFYDGGFIQTRNGMYNIEFLDKQKSFETSYSRDYKRIKSNEGIFKTSLALSKKKKLPRMLIQMDNAIREANGGYKPDIISLLGVVKNYLFVRTATEEKTELAIDVIALKNKELIKTIKMNFDRITSVYIQYEKLIVNQKNDEIGPYVSIYDIKLSEEP